MPTPLPSGQYHADDANFSGSLFHNVNLTAARFDDVNMSRVEIHNVNLSHASIRNACLHDLRGNNDAIASCLPFLLQLFV